MEMKERILNKARGSSFLLFFACLVLNHFLYYISTTLLTLGIEGQNEENELMREIKQRKE
jgi:hypothetical protein